jgi:hypothetical protein
LSRVGSPHTHVSHKAVSSPRPGRRCFRHSGLWCSTDAGGKPFTPLERFVMELFRPRASDVSSDPKRTSKRSAHKCTAASPGRRAAYLAQSRRRVSRSRLVHGAAQARSNSRKCEAEAACLGHSATIPHTQMPDSEPQQKHAITDSSRHCHKGG